MAFQVKPIDLITAPNFFSYSADNQWVVTHGSACTLAGQLWISDALGLRRYILPTTATLKVSFVRADSPQSASVAQTIVKTVSVNAQDRSLFTFNLTTTDTQAIISGSVIFEITDSGVGGMSAQWVKNYGLKKLMVGPGY